jgi:hypothetical protein
MSSASGTLVLVFPTANGLVVAADSRTRFRQKLYDVREKLHLADTQAPIVFAITGSGDFPDELPARVDPELWLRQCSYSFRGKDVVQTYLKRSPEFLLINASLDEIARALADAYSKFFLRFRSKIAEFTGQCFCRLVLCQVNPTDGEMRFGSIGLMLDENGIASVGDSRLVKFCATDAKTLELIGEVGYVDEHVLNGHGRRFLSAEEGIWKSKDLIQDLEGHEAALIARSIIAAAEKTSETIPIPSGSGIGGAVSCLLVTATSVMPI